MVAEVPNCQRHILKGRLAAEGAIRVASAGGRAAQVREQLIPRGERLLTLRAACRRIRRRTHPWCAAEVCFARAEPGFGCLHRAHANTDSTANAHLAFINSVAASAYPLPLLSLPLPSTLYHRFSSGFTCTQPRRAHEREDTQLHARSRTCVLSIGAGLRRETETHLCKTYAFSCRPEAGSSGAPCRHARAS